MTGFRAIRCQRPALVAVAVVSLAGCAQRAQQKSVNLPPTPSIERAESALAAQDHQLALRIFSELADQGVPEAQARLGWMYYSGAGVPEDFAKAVYWYRLAAHQGNPKAQFRLGYLHYVGRGVPKDFVESVRWYRLAAEQGHAVAQFNLGNKYSRGEGVPRDVAEGI